MSNVQLFCNGDFEVKVRENGSNLEFDAESVAKGLGFIEVKNKKQYVMWRRVNKYLNEFGYSAQVTKDDFIQESYVYLLMMKAENNLAVNFQKWLAFDVLPEIRKKKVYIDPSATDQEIDNAVRFATPQKRRSQLMDATIDGKGSVFNIYGEIKDYIKHETAEEKIKVFRHIERVLEDKKDTYGKDVAFIHKVEELKVQVAKDIDKVRNWENGAYKRRMSKEHKALLDEITVLRPPSIDEYHMLPYHPFSENSMYEPLTKTKWVKTKAFKYWCDHFPYFLMPSEEELTIDFSKPVKLYLAYDHKANADVQNYHKSAIDMIFKYYGQNDNVINEVEIVNKTNKHVNDYAEGKIYFLLKNVD
jgi:prophage antirepressor-like protein